jgi:hypothetical protein
MHNFFAGLMGLIVGFGSFFHPIHGVHSSLEPTQEASISATPIPSGFLHRGGGRGKGMSFRNGQRPFFGTVTTINGSTLTVQLDFPGRFAKPSITPPVTKTMTIILDSNTKYVDGTQSDITVHAPIAGVGKVNSDGTINATMIRLHAMLPGGRFGVSQEENEQNEQNETH